MQKETGMGFPRQALAGAVALAIFAATPASSGVPHTVQPGETLWSIAAANNFTTRALAAANGLPETAQVVTGRTIQIPSEYQAATALQSGAPAVSSGSPAPLGGYTVRWGETLSSIAARSGISVGRLAWMNGIDPSRPLLAG